MIPGMRMAPDAASRDILLTMPHGRPRQTA